MGYGLAKLEGQITVPTGGYPITVTDSGGSITYTVPAGTYYPNSSTALLSTIATALTADSTLAGTYSVTSDDANTTSTGKTTIGATGGGNISITWGASTTLRNLLGFSGDLSGATTYTSTGSCQYIWLPDVKRANPLVPEGQNGLPVTDATVTMAPSGKTKILKSSTRYRDMLEFRFLSGTKTFTVYESTAGESLQSFWLLTMGAGIPVRYHPDRSVDGTYVPWRCMAPQEFMVKPEFAGFVGGPGTDGSTLRWAFGPVEVVYYT